MAADPSQSGKLLVDIVIAVHDPNRPVARAIKSVLDDAPAGVRVIVVCHGMSSSAIAEQIANFPSAQLRVIEFSDGVASPAGPFNAGLASANAEYVGVMGSDDYLEPGAIRAWLDRVRTDRLDVLLAELKHQFGSSTGNPPVRVWRRRWLDPVKDRLFYRSAPLGLVRRLILEHDGLSFTERMRSGEDIAFSARLWSSGLRIGLARGAPHYIIGSDAISRVTTSRLDVASTLSPLQDLLQRWWIVDLPVAVRRSLSIKLIRVHLLSALRVRPRAGDWGDSDVEQFQSCLREVLRLAPGVLSPFARADRQLLDTVLRPGVDGAALERALSAYAEEGRVATILPRNLLHVLDRESVLRRYLVYAVDPRGRTQHAPIRAASAGSSEGG